MDFTKCIPKSDRYELDSLLLEILDDIEECLGYELRINSAYRSPAYEVRVGRSGSSSHCLGKAADIHCYTSSERYLIIKTALQKGINRIGIYKSFVHLDTATCKDGKNTCVIWYG